MVIYPLLNKTTALHLLTHASPHSAVPFYVFYIIRLSTQRIEAKMGY
jgi:hypothetical protein